MARYYRSDVQRNLPVSTEITGYAVSYLLRLGDPNAALKAACFLNRAWDGKAMPFETGPSPEGSYTYFFDCGIIVRGLLAAWRHSGKSELLDTAVAVGESMAMDFPDSDSAFHPILKLPDKKPVERDPLRWSRSAGCYQLKSALAWLELSEATGNPLLAQCYQRALEGALPKYGSFLPGHPDPVKVVDRLHPFLYFLEGLLPRSADPRCAAALCDGIARVGSYLADPAPHFERSDVYAQLLRVRLYADWAGVVPLDTLAAEREAANLAAFQAASSDPRIDGGFYFGRQDGAWMPYVNPVSTGFAAEALSLWDLHRSGDVPATWQQLI